MDGTTEPIIVVIGHPIAGNPTQFALETGFQAAQIDCRILSIDLPRSQFEAALAGMDAMRFRAVWVTPSCRASAENLLESRTLTLLDRGGVLIRERAKDRGTTELAEKSADSPPEDVEAVQSMQPRPLSFSLDLLVHDPIAKASTSWSHQSMKQQVWPKLVERTLQTRDTDCRAVWWIDPQADLSQTALSKADLEQQRHSLLEQLQTTNKKRYENLTSERIEIVHDVTQIPINDPNAKHVKEHCEDPAGEPAVGTEVIVFSGSQKPPPATWKLPPNSLTIDLNENWDAEYLAVWDRLKRSAADQSNCDCIRGLDVHAACLSKLTQTLFGQNVPPDIFLDAVDEYLAV